MEISCCRDASLPRPLSSLPAGFVPKELQERLSEKEVMTDAKNNMNFRILASLRPVTRKVVLAVEHLLCTGLQRGTVVNISPDDYMQKLQRARKKRVAGIRAAEADVMAARPPAFDVSPCNVLQFTLDTMYMQSRVYRLVCFCCAQIHFLDVKVSAERWAPVLDRWCGHLTTAPTRSSRSLAPQRASASQHWRSRSPCAKVQASALSADDRKSDKGSKLPAPPIQESLQCRMCTFASITQCHRPLCTFMLRSVHSRRCRVAAWCGGGRQSRHHARHTTAGRQRRRAERGGCRPAADAGAAPDEQAAGVLK